MNQWTRLRLAILLVGAVLVFVGAREMTLAGAAKETPDQLTCERLATYGPGDNAHVTLTDFYVCDVSFCYMEEDGKWKWVWVPAVPRGSLAHERLEEEGEDAALPTDIRVIIKTSKATSPYAVSALNNQESLTGLVMNRIDSLGDGEKKILQEAYPGVNFDTCWIVHVGRTPMSASATLGMIAAGLVILVAGSWKYLKRLWADDDSGPGGTMQFAPQHRSHISHQPEHRRVPAERRF